MSVMACRLESRRCEIQRTWCEPARRTAPELRRSEFPALMLGCLLGECGRVHAGARATRAGCQRRAQAERRLKSGCRGAERREERPASPLATALASARRLSRPQRAGSDPARESESMAGAEPVRGSGGTARRSPGRREPAHEPIRNRDREAVSWCSRTGLKANLSGHLSAQIREGLFDPKSGLHLVCPQGARLISLDRSLSLGCA